MGDIGRGLLQAVRLIVSLDPGTYEALGTSLRVTMSALFWSALAGFPFGIVLAFSHFRGKQGVMNVVYTLMGFPPVVAGLLVYLLFSRSGPLGVLQLLYTPTAMVVAQIALALPVIVGLSVLGLRGADKGVFDLALTLGATRAQRPSPCSARHAWLSSVPSSRRLATPLARSGRPCWWAAT